jgi:TatD DNase family protein
MIDTHCHLTDPRLHSQLNDVLIRASAAGVSRMITIGTGLDDDRQCIDVCRGRDNIRCAIGVHPNYVKETDTARLWELRQLQSDPSVIALGEMGLDYHYGKDNREQQADVFHFQLQLAIEMNKPVVIHCREAADDCLAILRNYPTIRALFHCYTGTVADARRILDAGYFLGFTGVITFKNSGELRDVVKLTPSDRLVVETDAPYLAPEPHRKQKVNEPALVMHTATMVAQLKGMTLDEIDQLTTQNAARFFGWP